MAPTDDERLSLKGKPPRASDLTVMIVGKVGKFRRFRISSRVFFWSSLFFAFYMVASVLVFNTYFSELRSNRTKSQLLERLQDAIKDTKRNLHRSRQQLALLEEAISDMGARQEIPAEPARSEPEKPKRDEPAGETSVEKVPEKFRQKLVDIKDLTVDKEETRLAVDFKLVNVQQDQGPINGYVHIIAVNNRSDPPQLLTYPKVALRNGIPVNYKRGQLFLIKRFKTIRGEYSLNSKTETPGSIRVLVYNDLGELIFQKEFEVQDAS